MRRAAIAPLAFTAVLALACGPTAPRTSDLAADERAALVRALEREAALDREPLSPLAAAELARALVQAGRPGTAYAHFRAALFLLENPPSGRPEHPPELGRDLERAAAAARRVGPGTKPADEDDAPGAFGRRSSAPSRDTRLGRPANSAARELELATTASREGREAEAIERLWRACDLDPALRVPALYREIARLERRRALAAFFADKREEGHAALRRAFRAVPDDRDTLFLLARRGPEAEAAYARKLLLALHPDTPEARFLALADRVRGASGSALVSTAAPAADADPATRSEYSRLLAEQEAAEAQREAEAAKARFDRARAAAEESRQKLEGAMQSE